MAIEGPKLNLLFSGATPVNGAGATKMVGQSFAGATGGSQSNNPFDAQNKFGVGLVNSDLAAMSYKLPNGKNSTCNTIGIG